MELGPDDPSGDGFVQLYSERLSRAFHAALDNAHGQGVLRRSVDLREKAKQDCIEFTSLINIRPSQDNRSMVIEDETTRTRVREIAFALLGRGEALE